ncbi:MAG TPA: methyl-accepting chemotaxis protein, partial [Burkholderiaceae bacterium]
MKNIENLKIADIIGAIDGVEFQTDILALSVAVEAAGEEGHGMTVAAREMRSLAQRSARAASEIEALIGEGVEKVESASKLLGDAGSRMRDIASQVMRLADMVGEIGSASPGVTRIASAIAQFDEITERNAALVEHCTAAA